MSDQYNSSTGQFPDTKSAVARVQDTVAEKASDAKNVVVEYGRKAVDKIDAQRGPAADALGQTASSLHEKGEKAAGVAHRAADKLQATADYIRENDLKAMGDDVVSLVKRYPGQSLAAAAVVGFLIARGLRRSD